MYFFCFLVCDWLDGSGLQFAISVVLVIGLANLGQYMKFGLILGGMNRSGLCVRV